MVSIPTTARHFYTHDANYNVTSAITPSAGVAERYSYSPYGKVTIRDANFSADADGKSDIGNEYLFTGRRLDAETGFYYFRNRYYSAEMGRFVNRDPIGYLHGQNLHEYVSSLPTCFVDPYGTTEISGRPDLPAEMPPIATSGYNKSCATNCAVGYKACVTSGKDEGVCSEWWAQCRDYCSAQHDFSQNFGPGWGAAWGAGISAGVAAAGITVSASESAAIAIAEKLGVGVGKVRAAGGAIAGIATIIGIYEGAKTIKQVQSKIDRINMRKIYKTWAVKTEKGDKKGRACNGNRCTGVFAPGFVQDRNNAHALWSGFWVTPCGSTGDVFIYTRDPKNKCWFKSVVNIGSGVKGCNKQQCYWPDEIFRIEMKMLPFCGG